MTKSITLFISFLLWTCLLVSCSGPASDEKNTAGGNESREKVSDSLLAEPVKNPIPEAVKPADIDFRIFFRNFDMSDVEGFEGTRPETVERDRFRKEKEYTFCYDSEGFDYLELSGQGEQLSLEINKDRKNVFSKNNFSVNGKFRFTSKDFNFIIGSVYSIVLRQNEKVIFQGKIDSQQCM